MKKKNRKQTKKQSKQEKRKYSVHHDIILPLALRSTSMRKPGWFKFVRMLTLFYSCLYAFASIVDLRLMAAVSILSL